LVWLSATETGALQVATQLKEMLAVFEKEGMISVHAERRKGTLITVLNYSEYAEKNTRFTRA